jgi:cytosine permease
VVVKLLRRLMGGLDGVATAHSTIPVPPEHSVPGYRVALVCIGVGFTLSGLYIGSELATTLGLSMGIKAVVIGSLVLAAMSVPTAIVGARTRLSTYMIVTQVFGTVGAKAINLCLAVVLLGWYSVTAGLFGRTFYLTAATYAAISAPQWLYTIASSVFVIATTVFGFWAYDRLSRVAAPLLVILTAYVAWLSLSHAPWNALLAVSGSHPSLNTGISVVIGGLIVNVVLMPDITRYAASTRDCILISLLGNGIGSGGALVLAMIPALAFKEIDPMKYMAALGLVGVAFGILVVSTWTMNMGNLYSTALVTSTAVRTAGYGRMVVICGVAGTALALAGIADRLIQFLVLLGLIVPPIAAVYLTDFFVLRRHDFGPAVRGDTARTNLNGLAAVATGAAIGIVMYFAKKSITGVPAIESFVSAVAIYSFAEKIRMMCIRDRSWGKSVSLLH